MPPAIQVTVKEIEPATLAFVSMKGPYTQISEAFGKLYGWIGLFYSISLSHNGNQAPVL